MELILLASPPTSSQTNAPWYLLRVSERLIPVTRESLERLGMLRESAQRERLHLEE